MKNSEKYTTPQERVKAFSEQNSIAFEPEDAIEDFSQWLEKEVKSKTSNFKPCPFCGGKDVRIMEASKDPKTFKAQCQECQCQTSAYLAKQSATEMWNTRT